MALAQRLRTYTVADLRGDVLAGLTLAVVFVPQAMAYAALAGLPPVVGLYAAIFPSLVYALIGSSRHLSVGPIALTSLLVASNLDPIAAPGTEAYAAHAVTLSLLVGVMLLALGAMRAGFLVNFLSHPAMLGFNAAAAVLTGMSQVKPLLGLRADIVVSAENPWPVLMHLDTAHAITAPLGVAGVVALLGMRRWLPRLPAPLVVCVVTTVLVGALGWDTIGGVGVVGTVPTDLPTLAVPAFGLETVSRLVPGATSIAIVGYAASVTIAKALAARDRGRIEPNRELLGVGAANVVGSFFGCFPVAGGLSRSTVNAQAGARSQLAGAFASLLVLAALLLAGAAFEHLPYAALAAIVMVSAARLVDLRGAREVFRTKRRDAMTLVVTFGATLGIGLEPGLVVGMLTALAFFVWRTAVPHSAEMGRIPGTMVYETTRHPGVETCPQVPILRVAAPLYYANARFLEDRVMELASTRPDLRLVVLMCSSVNDMDTTAVESLRRVVGNLRAAGADLHLVGVIGPVAGIVERSGLADLLGADHVHRTILEAAPRWMSTLDRRFCEEQCRFAAFPDCTLIPRARLSSDRARAARFSPQI